MLFIENINTIIYVREQIRGIFNLAASINKKCITRATGAICITEYESKWVKNNNKYIVYNGMDEEEEMEINNKNDQGIVDMHIVDNSFLNMAIPAIQKGGFMIILATYILKLKWALERLFQQKPNKEK